MRGGDEAEMIRRSCRGADDGGPLQHFRTLQIGEALERRIERHRRCVGECGRMDGDRAHRHLVAEQREHAERTGVRHLDAPRNERLVREARSDEGFPVGVDPALLEKLLCLQHVADHLFAGPHDDPAAVERPPALALQPLLRLRRDLFVRQRPAPFGELLRCRRGRNGRRLRIGDAARDIAQQQTAGNLGNVGEEVAPRRCDALIARVLAMLLRFGLLHRISSSSFLRHRAFQWSAGKSRICRASATVAGRRS